mmetsp:Transcript_433/g.1506  ORF Transcript_433/g.1506 Transcript_433/m.1506 type:complete len:275 (+) Transcript_433:1278-2102(+)
MGGRRGSSAGLEQRAIGLHVGLHAPGTHSLEGHQRVLHLVPVAALHRGVDQAGVHLYIGLEAVLFHHGHPLPGARGLPAQPKAVDDRPEGDLVGLEVPLEQVAVQLLHPIRLQGAGAPLDERVVGDEVRSRARLTHARVRAQRHIDEARGGAEVDEAVVHMRQATFREHLLAGVRGGDPLRRPPGSLVLLARSARCSSTRGVFPVDTAAEQLAPRRGGEAGAMVAAATPPAERGIVVEAALLEFLRAWQGTQLRDVHVHQATHAVHVVADLAHL